MSDFNIQIKDFQSLSKVDLVIEDGLNIVIGKTNEGKTAVIRAIDSAIFNTGKDEMVKAGKRYSGVLIDNGTDKFAWRRDSHGKNEKTLYQINSDKSMTKVGRTQLPEIAEMFNISEVRLANGVKEKINFWFQGDAPFLTNKTAGQLFMFLSQSSCEKYMKITKQIDSDRKTQKKDIDILNANIDALRNINDVKQKIIENNEGYDELYEKLVILGDDIEDFNKIEADIDRLTSLKARIHVKREHYKVIDENLNNINFSEIKDSYESLTATSSYLETLQEIIEEQNKKAILHNDRTNQLEELDISLEGLDSKVADYKKSIEELETLNTYLGDLSSLIDNIELKESKLTEKQKDLKVIKKSIKNVKIDPLKSSLQSIELLDSDVKELSRLVNDYEFKESVLFKCQEDLDVLVKKNDELVATFEEFKTDIGVCPYCNNTLTATHTH